MVKVEWHQRNDGNGQPDPIYTVSVTESGVTINYTFVSTSANTLTFNSRFPLTKQ